MTGILRRPAGRYRVSAAEVFTGRQNRLLTSRLIVERCTPPPGDLGLHALLIQELLDLDPIIQRQLLVACAQGSATLQVSDSTPTP